MDAAAVGMADKTEVGILDIVELDMVAMIMVLYSLYIIIRYGITKDFDDFCEGKLMEMKENRWEGMRWYQDMDMDNYSMEYSMFVKYSGERKNSTKARDALRRHNHKENNALRGERCTLRCHRARQAAAS